ncbi:hypothetical protein ACFX13_000640 [Malus domestica]
MTNISKSPFYRRDRAGRASIQVQHATFHIFQKRWRPKKTSKALPKCNDPLSEQRLSVQAIHHHFTR